MEQIQYTGDSSPTVIFAPAPLAEPDLSRRLLSQLWPGFLQRRIGARCKKNRCMA